MIIDNKWLEEVYREVPQEDTTSEEEKLILMDEILKRKPKVIVETGTHRGLTTLFLAYAVKEAGVGHIWTADPHEWGARGNFRKFPDLEEHITFEQCRGSQTSAENIDLLFIDGFHEKTEVLEEIDALFPKLSKDAIVYFHDANGSNPSCDIPGALEERNLKVKYLKTLNGMAVYEKKPKKTTKKK